MKKRAFNITVILMIVAGLSLLLYPTVSGVLKGLAQRRAISGYIASVEPVDGENYEQLLEAARAYNERLAQKGRFLFTLSQEELAEYNSLLDVDSTGIMGYVSIPKVDIYLPIYHGTGDEALQSGAGHLEGSSLPVGGPGVHAVLSAHTGLPSARLFTDIDQLEEGDAFTVQVLKETLNYQVDQIQVVLPSQTEALEIEAGEDYCTLLTCTPYGVNSHRLLVRGRRVPVPSGEEEFSHAGEDPDGGHLSGRAVKWVLPAAAVVMLAAFLYWKRLRRLKKKEEPGRESPGGFVPRDRC